MTGNKPSIYFVATELGEVHHGPAVYTRALWDMFRDSEDFEFHLVVLKSDIVNPKIHVPESESGKRAGFYRRMAKHVSNVVPKNKNTLLHVNSAHLISTSIAKNHQTVVQINDTEVCQHRISRQRIQQYGMRRMLALQWRRKRERNVAHASRRVVCNSDFTADMVRRQYGLPDQKVNRIYKALPLAPFLDAQPINVGAGKLELVFIGNNWQRKGLKVLIEAIAELKKRAADLQIRLRVYGTPPESTKNEYRQFAAECGVADMVQLEGTLQRPDAPDVLANSSMLVLPSFEEALGLVSIEAIATGIPVVGSQVGGIPEVINNSRLGTLVEAGNPKLLANAIEDRYYDGTETQLVQYRKESSKRFSIDTLRRNVETLYQSIFLDA